MWKSSELSVKPFLQQNCLKFEFMVRRIWLKGSLIKVSAQLIKAGESESRDPAIQTRTWVSILSSGRQRARTTAPAQSIARPEDQAVLPHCRPRRTRQEVNRRPPRLPDGSGNVIHAAAIRGKLTVHCTNCSNLKM